jgi:hypothetical protein
MRTSFILSIFLCLFISVNGQVNFRTGSLKLDGDLNQINVEAKADFGKFKAEMGVTYNIAEARIDYYHAELRMEPAEIYFALEISNVTSRPIDDVVRVYTDNRGNGWGKIAQDLGIKPGSPAFHALKGKVKNKAGNGTGKEKGQNKGKGKGKKH